MRPPHRSGLEALHATFVRHRYALHTHETFTIALVERGAACFDLAGQRHVAPAGRTFVIPPDTPHTGESATPAGYTYKVLYIDPEQAAAGLWTTPEDVARFAIAIQQTAAGTAPQPIMSQAIAAQMLKARLDDYGLGVGVTGVGPAAQFSHGGSNEGFRCQFNAFKDRASGVVVMTNSDRGGQIMQEIVRAVAREYGWPGMGAIEREPESPAVFPSVRQP